jgi:hypothetical protein
MTVAVKTRRCQRRNCARISAGSVIVTGFGGSGLKKPNRVSVIIQRHYERHAPRSSLADRSTRPVPTPNRKLCSAAGCG